MTFRKYVMISMVLLCGSVLMLGCSSDDPAPLGLGDEAPPAAISGLSARLLSGGDVELTWDASTQPRVSGYNVYRVVESEQGIGRLNTSPIANNRYIDTSVALGPVYQYLVTAVSAKGLESAFTAVSINTDPKRGKGGAWED